jgi:uncharacterized membrane protein YtjA (UPF0391 family)
VVEPDLGRLTALAIAPTREGFDRPRKAPYGRVFRHLAARFRDLQLRGRRTNGQDQRLLWHKERFMLRWAVIFLILAVAAGAFGFWGVEGLAMQIAWILFVLFLILFVVSLVTGRRIRID